MFKVDELALEQAAAQFPDSGMKVRAVLMGLEHQLREAGASGDYLNAQLRALLGAHKAMAEVGEEMPSAEELTGGAHDELRSVRQTLDHIAPTIARLQRERDEARAALLVARSRGQSVPVSVDSDDGQPVSVFRVEVDTSEAEAKIERLCAKIQATAAELQALTAKCSDGNIGIPDPPPPPPPSVVDDDDDDIIAYQETRSRVANTLDNCSYGRGPSAVRGAREAVEEWAAGQ